jgi:hypothetical protein
MENINFSLQAGNELFKTFCSKKIQRFTRRIIKQRF